MSTQPDLFNEDMEERLAAREAITEELLERDRLNKIYDSPNENFFTKVGALIDIIKLEWRTSL